MLFYRRLKVPLALAVLIVAVCAAPLGQASSEPRALSAKELDEIRKVLPQSRIPREFYQGKKGPHGKGDPHAQLGPDRLVKVALQHLAEGRRGEAMKTLDAGVTKFPENVQLRGIRGSIFLQHSDYTKALSDFEAALRIKPDDPLLLVNRAQAYRSFNRLEEALTDLDKAVELMPDLVPARFNRGSIYVTKGDFVKARADFERCIAIDPHVAAPRFNLAVTLEGLGQRKEAIAEMERFLKIAKVEGWKKVAQEQLDVWKKQGATHTAEQNRTSPGPAKVAPSAAN